MYLVFDFHRSVAEVQEPRVFQPVQADQKLLLEEGSFGPNHFGSPALRRESCAPKHVGNE
jgi:hypothetical protein